MPHPYHHIHCSPEPNLLQKWPVFLCCNSKLISLRCLLALPIFLDRAQWPTIRSLTESRECMYSYAKVRLLTQQMMKNGSLWCFWLTVISKSVLFILITPFINIHARERYIIVSDIVTFLHNNTPIFQLLLPAPVNLFSQIYAGTVYCHDCIGGVRWYCTVTCEFWQSCATYKYCLPRPSHILEVLDCKHLARMSRAKPQREHYRSPRCKSHLLEVSFTLNTQSLML